MELKESFAIGTRKGEGEVARELMAGSPVGEKNSQFGNIEVY